MRIQLSALLLSLGLAVAPGHAQATRDSVRARAIEALPIGTQLRLVAAGHEYFGQLAARGALDLTLDRHGARFTVPRTEVQALWIPGGHATREGFWTGAAIGALAGGAVGYFFGAFMCESECGANRAYGAVVGGGAGGLAVGFVGAIIGSAFPRWERRFP